MKKMSASIEMTRATEMTENLPEIIKSLVITLIDNCDYDELGIIISALTHALEARLIEDGENPAGVEADVSYESKFGLYRITADTLTKLYRDWLQQVASFTRRECHNTPIVPRAKRTHTINTLIITGLTLHKDATKLPDSVAKTIILNNTATFLPILMMYSFEKKLPFKIDTFIKDVVIRYPL